MTVPAPPAPATPGQIAQVTEALIQKATRFFVLHNDPAGFGELTDFGAVLARRDYVTPEYLFGLQTETVEWEPLTGLVTPADVIRNGLGADPANFPADRLPDVQRAIDAAAEWIGTYTQKGFGLA